MKQLADDYEAGNWSPFGEIGGKVGEDRPGEGDTRDKGPHAVTASNSTASTKTGKYM